MPRPNPVPTAAQLADGNIVAAIPQMPGKFFGGIGISENDWTFIESFIVKNGLKNIAEFGAGEVSTPLFNTLSVKMTTFESDQAWIDDLQAIGPDYNLVLWDGINAPDPQPFDLIFVDGPRNGVNRGPSTAYAAANGTYVIQHDQQRPDEQAWAEKYLAPLFKDMGVQGDKCRLWQKI